MVSVTRESAPTTISSPLFATMNVEPLNLFKNIQIREKARIQLRLEAYNAFNHTEWGSFNSSIVFNATGKLINLPTQLGGTGGRLGFGALNSIRLNSQRIVEIAAKIYF